MRDDGSVLMTDVDQCPIELDFSGRMRTGEFVFVVFIHNYNLETELTDKQLQNLGTGEKIIEKRIDLKVVLETPRKQRLSLATLAASHPASGTQYFIQLYIYIYIEY